MVKYNNPWGSDYWDKIGRRTITSPFQEKIALYKKSMNLSLISAWVPSAQGDWMLKTDLFEEAFGKDSLMDELNISYTHSVGIDISGVIVRKASKRFPHNPLLKADVCRLPFKKGSFELIVSTSTLDHLPIKNLPIAIKEFFRILKPGRCLVLTLDSKHNPLHRLASAMRSKYGLFHIERCYSVQEISTLLKECRFHVTDSKPIYHIPPGVNFLAKLLHRIFGPLANKPIQYITEIFLRFDKLPTRFFTGRYIAIRAIKPQ